MTSAKDKAVTKEAMGYREFPRCCANCRFYFSHFETKTRDGVYGREQWDVEKGKRCSLGGFPVKKLSVCDEWSGK